MLGDIGLFVKPWFEGRHKGQVIRSQQLLTSGLAPTSALAQTTSADGKDPSTAVASL